MRATRWRILDQSPGFCIGQKMFFIRKHLQTKIFSIWRRVSVLFTVHIVDSICLLPRSLLLVFRCCFSSCTERSESRIKPRVSLDMRRTTFVFLKSRLTSLVLTSCVAVKKEKRKRKKKVALTLLLTLQNLSGCSDVYLPRHGVERSLTSLRTAKRETQSNISAD